MKRHLRFIPILIFVAALLSGCGFYHTVEKGDTIYSIAKRYDVDPDELMESNNVNDPRKLQIGQKLRISRFENADRRAQEKRNPHAVLKPTPAPTPKPQTNHNTEKRIEPTPPPAIKNPPIKLIWPVKGTLLTGFGKQSDGRDLDGIEIGAPEGAKVIAAADGEVILADDRYAAYGNLVVIRHKQDFVTLYAHNRRILVRQGDRVTQGQPIAEVGSTGRTQTPKLHFELRKKKTPINPLEYLPSN